MLLNHFKNSTICKSPGRHRNPLARRRTVKSITEADIMHKPIISALAALLLNLISVHTMAAEVELDSIIAIVNEDIVLASDFNRERETLTRQNPPNLPTGAELDRAVLERLIVQSLQIQAAERRGIRIDDNNLQRAIEDMARNNNMNVTQMREALSRDGINFLEFRENIRKELLISTLTRREIESNLTVTDAEIEEQLSTENDVNTLYSYQLDHALVRLPQQADADLTATALSLAQQIASDGRDGVPFNRVIERLRNDGINNVEGSIIGPEPLSAMPPLFAEQVKGMQEKDVTEPLRSAAGFHIIKLVSRSSEIAVAKRVRARHILASTRNGRSAAEAKALITEIADKLSEGANFTQMAIEFSEDPSSAANGGDLGWFGRGEMVQNFEQLAFTTPANQITEPFFTQFGWHILEVTDKEFDVGKRDERESTVRAQLRQKKAEEKFASWLIDLRDNAYVELRGFAKALQ